MVVKIKEWIDKRWPLSAVVRLAIEEDITGGARFAYSLGSAIFIIFTLQAVTGIVQLFYYVPTTDHAYDSISYLRTRLPFGWLMHGLHFWGAQLMIILILLHISRVFLWGAYKNPRELTWIAGLMLFLTAMGFTFTGGPLHWDQSGYWIGDVSTGIAGTVPIAGSFMKQLIRGGEDMGQAALSRLFTIHILVLPLALVGLFGIHIIAMRRFGSVGPWEEKKRKQSGPFWPDQLFKDTLVATTVIFLLVALAVLLPPRYSGPADPLDLSFIPKPEWNFLFLYETLKYFEGPLEPVGTVGVPTALIALLILLPFIDRNPERNPFKRPVAMTCAFLLAAFIVGISVKGYLSPGFARAPEKAGASASQSKSSLITIPANAFSAGAGEARPRPLEETKQPAVPAVGTEHHSAMKGLLPGKAAYIIGGADRGLELFRRNCMSCHGAEGISKVPNQGSDEGKVPDLNPVDEELFNADAQIFAHNIDRFIQHGSVPSGPNPVIKMPAFGDTNTLTQQEIANIEAYVLRLNKVDRAQIVNPGMEPRRFLFAAAAAYLIVILMLGGLWSKRSKT